MASVDSILAPLCSKILSSIFYFPNSLFIPLWFLFPILAAIYFFNTGFLLA